MKNDIKIYAIKARVTPKGKNKQQKFKPAFRTFQGVIIDDQKKKKEEISAFATEQITLTLDLKEDITYKVDIIEIVEVNKHFTISTK